MVYLCPRVRSARIESTCDATGSVRHRCVASEGRSLWSQAAEAALAQAAEQHAELREQSQQLRLAEQALRQRQRDAAERDSELKAFEQSLTVRAIPHADCMTTLCGVREARQTSARS